MGVPYAEVIGDPIDHSRSPLIHKFWLRKLGIEGDYRAVRVGKAELPDYLESRRDDPDWRGCNVTMPLKEAAAQLVDEVRAFAVSAVNCIVPDEALVVGYNTDTDGISESLDIPVDTAHPICVIGAGGAAQAAVAALDISAAFKFRCIARNEERARSLLAPYRPESRVFGYAFAQEALCGCSGVVNATPLGMLGAPPMPGPVLDGLGGLRRRAFALDLVYVPAETELLRRARKVGVHGIDGLNVLIGQAASAFEHLFGAAAPRRFDAELRKMLTS